MTLALAALSLLCAYLFWAVFVLRRELAALQRSNRTTTDLSIGLAEHYRKFLVEFVNHGEMLDSHEDLLSNHERRIADGEKGARFWLGRDGKVRRSHQ